MPLRGLTVILKNPITGEVFEQWYARSIVLQFGIKAVIQRMQRLTSAQDIESIRYETKDIQGEGFAIKDISWHHVLNDYS